MIGQALRHLFAFFLCLVWSSWVPAYGKDQPNPPALPGPGSVVERLGFGSCLHQEKPQPVWKAVIAAKPQLFLMMGDNVYGDFEDRAATKLIEAYEKQAHRPDFKSAFEAIPMLPVWDDHDFGKNDAGADFEWKAVAAQQLFKFWGLAAERPVDQGLYTKRSFGPEGKRVQIVLLDTRAFRSPLKLKTASFPYQGKYEPDPDPAKTMLGDVQWRWLDDALREPADLRIVVSSIQVLSEGHGFERWGNLPRERDKLLDLVAAAKGPVLLLSGDRHAGSLYIAKRNDREVIEMTSSSLNLTLPSLPQDVAMSPLASGIFGEANFGLLEIDWQARVFTVRLMSEGGGELISVRRSF